MDAGDAMVVLVMSLCDLMESGLVDVCKVAGDLGSDPGYTFWKPQGLVKSVEIKWGKHIRAVYQLSIINKPLS